jgi:hypothetical protein
VKQVLASYRWRRRLLWLTAVAVVAGAAVAIGVHWSNTAPYDPATATHGHLKINYTSPKAVRLKLQDRATALGTANRFIYTAVARKHVDRAWSLAAADLRAGMTRKEWDTGNLPFPPYPVADARWRLLYSDTSGVGFSIALFPAKGAQQSAQVFIIGLHTVGRATHRHWLVDGWQPAPTNTSISGLAAGSGGGFAADGVRPQLGANFGKAKESPIWLLLPVALLSLVLLVPLGIGAVNWYRGRRAEALFGD